MRESNENVSGFKYKSGWRMCEKSEWYIYNGEGITDLN
jgi:hypothetical protein